MPDTNHAPYAADPGRSRGRRYPEPAPAYRTEYERDRDRIIHCTAFRRLMYKTQVFVYDEGDLYRTRLTHSLEVAQIARSVARVLGLDEALTEAISLAHDLGHTPFGHAGQDALNAAMRDYGGFEHNWQSLRVVDELEERYADFPGLNLTFETREGILKHCSLNNARELGEVGERFLNRTQPGLEAQLANLADGIAYNCHDVDDGLRSGLLTVDELLETSLFREHCEEVRRLHPGLALRRLAHETVRRMINALVTDLIEVSKACIVASDPASIDEVRTAGQPLIAFSPEMDAVHRELGVFLRGRLYDHPRVRKMSGDATRMIQMLFKSYLHEPSHLPADFAARAVKAEDQRGLSGRARIVADYVAGMTDRYARQEYQRFSGDGSGFSRTA